MADNERNIGKSRNTKNSLPRQLIINDTEISSPPKVAEHFNKYFVKMLVPIWQQKFLKLNNTLKIGESLDQTETKYVTTNQKTDLLQFIIFNCTLRLCKDRISSYWDILIEYG